MEDILGYEQGSIEKITGKQLTYTDGYITFPLGYSSH